MKRVLLAAIQSTPLDVASVLDAVSKPDVGGAAVFVGAVRDHDGGRAVTALSYSEHPSALMIMREVVERVAVDFPEAHLAVVHRVGDLSIGDLAVVVAAGCPHRDTAFEAARRLIDDVKRLVPIWKHQRFTDGSEEWVGLP